MRKLEAPLKLAALLLVSSIPAYAQRVVSIYTPKIQAVHFDKLKPFSLSSELNMTCLSTKENPFFIGFAHQITIQSTLENVAKVFENFDAYPEIFDTLKDTKLISTSEDADKTKHLFVHFESVIPLPFVPNTLYDIWYDISSHQIPDQKFYTFQLAKSKDLKSMDGYAFIKKGDANSIIYNEIDFLDANWGIAKNLAPKSIWRDSVSDIIETDYALKFRAEHPEWKAKQVKKEAQFGVSDKQMQKQIDDCLANKKDSMKFLAEINPDVTPSKQKDKK